MILKRFFDTLVYQGLEAFGRYYSVYRGHVLDNEDPDGMNRLKLIIPSIFGKVEHPVWAYSRNNFSGQGYGVQILPQKGDMVMVEFDNGDSRFPIWSHGHFAIGEKPEEFATPQVYGFKSPKGQIIVIDDRDGVEKIIINHGDNEGLVKVIELTDKLNNLEQKVNDFLDHYRVHQVIDPLSGMAGPLIPTPLAPINLVPTQQYEIENDKVTH